MILFAAKSYGNAANVCGLRRSTRRRFIVWQQSQCCRCSLLANRPGRGYSPDDGSRRCPVLLAFNKPNRSAFSRSTKIRSCTSRLFWESRTKLGVTDDTFDIIEMGQTANMPQVSRATVQLVGDSGEKTLSPGYTVRTFTAQPTLAADFSCGPPMAKSS
jgi:hypothetical protein